jgi:hypothetical protein
MAIATCCAVAVSTDLLNTMTAKQLCKQLACQVLHTLLLAVIYCLAAYILYTPLFLSASGMNLSLMDPRLLLGIV